MLTDCFRTKELTLLTLGLCPLLAIANTVTNALAMGTVFLIISLSATMLFYVLRQFIPYTMRLLMLLIIVAFMVTVMELLMSAFYYEWYRVLGIYVPLLSMNSLILSYVESSIVVNKLTFALAKSLIMSLYVMGILLALGLIREGMPLVILGKDSVVMSSIEPLTAFFILGLIMALIQYIALAKVSPK